MNRYIVEHTDGTTTTTFAESEQHALKIVGTKVPVKKVRLERVNV
jgi:hypothetical protein